MKKKPTVISKTLNDHIGCYGTFSMQDTICRKYCALKLRCAIEHDQNMRVDLLEEIIESEAMFDNIQ
ncbi:MAG: hypothetical protein PHP23_08905 [Desulfobacterales bacterium]|nr:hypothetical protein [Desulfobacterales bacterium]MDD4071217.1 hypothetical protein [Desulfobacterales bacterium]MDD4392225.1 hypothetical protein [Desulfobacterales bacterium]